MVTVGYNPSTLKAQYDAVADHVCEGCCGGGGTCSVCSSPPLTVDVAMGAAIDSLVNVCQVKSASTSCKWLSAPDLVALSPFTLTNNGNCVWETQVNSTSYTLRNYTTQNDCTGPYSDTTYTGLYIRLFHTGTQWRLTASLDSYTGIVRGFIGTSTGSAGSDCNNHTIINNTLTGCIYWSHNGDCAVTF